MGMNNGDVFPTAHSRLFPCPFFSVVDGFGTRMLTAYTNENLYGYNGRIWEEL